MEACGRITEVKNINSPKFEDLARFAVDEHNKKNNAMELQFVGLVNVKEQVVEGVMYYITLEATDEGQTKSYEAKVWEKEWMNFKQLVEFKLILVGDGYSA